MRRRAWPFFLFLYLWVIFSKRKPTVHLIKKRKKESRQKKPCTTSFTPLYKTTFTKILKTTNKNAYPLILFELVSLGQSLYNPGLSYGKGGPEYCCQPESPKKKWTLMDQTSMLSLSLHLIYLVSTKLDTSVEECGHNGERATTIWALEILNAPLQYCQQDLWF